MSINKGLMPCSNTAALEKYEADQERVDKPEPDPMDLAEYVRDSLPLSQEEYVWADTPKKIINGLYSVKDEKHPRHIEAGLLQSFEGDKCFILFLDSAKAEELNINQLNLVME